MPFSASAPIPHPDRRTLARIRTALFVTFGCVVAAACSDTEPTGPADPVTPALAVTTGRARSGGPKPAAEKVLFVAGSGTPGSSIFAMNPDGSEITRLTDGAADDAPSWSPDYRRIVFTRGSGLNPTIITMTASGRRERVIGAGRDPVWSPDGSRIAYSAYHDGDNEIYVMNADGSDVTQVTTADGEDIWPSWSPDGSRLAFSSDRLGGQMEIYVMNADGTQQAKLTNCTAESAGCGRADWSPVPGDDRIVFTSFFPAGKLQIINADGTGLTTVLQHLVWDASWSRDGSRIAVLNTALGAPGSDIYSLRADGTELTRLTFDGNKNANPAWSR